MKPLMITPGLDSITPESLKPHVRDVLVVLVVDPTNRCDDLQSSYPDATVYCLDHRQGLDAAMQQHPQVTRVDLMWIRGVQNCAAVVALARSTIKRTRWLVCELHGHLGNNGRLDASSKSLISAICDHAPGWKLIGHDHEMRILLQNQRASIGRKPNLATLPATISNDQTPPQPSPRPASKIDQRNREFTAWYARQLVGHDFGTILEIGANDGSDTKQFLQAFPEAEIHCFEPDPRAIQKWRAQILDPRATLHECALSSQNGTVTLHQSGGTAPGACWQGYGEWDKSGSILPFDRHKENSPWMDCGQTTLEVLAMTLDTWSADHQEIFDFVWVDVQGAELLIVQGGPLSLDRTRYFYAECDPRPNYQTQASLDDLKRAMWPLGFVYLGEWAGFNHLWKNLTL